MLIILQGITSIFYWTIGASSFFGGIYLFITYIRNGDWIALILLLIFGSFVVNLYQSIIYFISVPFLLILAYFTSKIDAYLSRKEEIYDVDYISPDGKVIETEQSDDKINRNLAIWFFLSYILGLGWSLVNTKLHKDWGLNIYVFGPTIPITIFLVGASLPLMLINLIRRKKAIGVKRVFLTTLLKVYSILYFILLLFELIS